jgi:hypothetical protein
VICQLLNEFKVDHEFITKQILKICLYLDYSDEMGRRSLIKILIERLKMSKDKDEILLIQHVLLFINLDDQSEVSLIRCMKNGNIILH